MEFGFDRGDARTSFHPPWPEMEQIVVDADAGLVEFCAAALPAWVPPWRVHLRRLFPWEIYGPLARGVERVVTRIAASVRPGVVGVDAPVPVTSSKAVKRRRGRV